MLALRYGRQTLAIMLVIYLGNGGIAGTSPDWHISDLNNLLVLLLHIYEKMSPANVSGKNSQGVWSPFLGVAPPAPELCPSGHDAQR